MTHTRRFEIALPAGHPALRLQHEDSELRQRLRGGEL